MIKTAMLLGLLASGSNASHVEFVACPVYRDTNDGRKSGCWLADDPATGVRYDVSAAPTKPDWNHAVLVEGVPAPKLADLCGGQALEPVRVSVLDHPCTRHQLPAQGYKGRRFALPERNVRPLYEPRTAPARPFKTARFTVPFDHGKAFVAYQLADYYLDQALEYAIAVAPARVVIRGSAQGKTRMVSGTALVEPASLARERAEVIKRAFVLRGIPENSLQVAAPTDGPFAPAVFDGIATAHDRRVDIEVVPQTPVE
jgi:outer membrane protein OmpA-like peptidoglycan-associated protein